MDAVLHLLEQVMTSPWLYVLVLAVALLDAFLPIVPSETAVITAGVFAATGTPNLFLLVLAATLGALAGDHVSYAIGRRSGRRLLERLPDDGRRRAAFTWAREALLTRGGSTLIVSRYIPGGRTAMTLTTGAIGYPRRSFLRYDVLACTFWAVTSSLIGYLGGKAFESQPLKGLAVGLGFSLLLAGTVELVRHVRGRHPARMVPAPAVAAPEAGAARAVAAP